MKSYVQWLLGARNWITMIIERSDHSLVTYWGLNFCWWLFTTFWYVISKKRKKSCFFEIWKKRKIRILEHCYLHNLITVQPPRSTRSSSLVTLARPSTSPSVRITDRSFQYASPRLWNQLPASLRQPRTVNFSNFASPSSLSGTSSISSINSPLSSPITPHSSTPDLKLFFSANPSHGSLPFLLPDLLHGFPGLFTDTSEHVRFFTF